jgi:hypothetical protein
LRGGVTAANAVRGVAPAIGACVRVCLPRLSRRLAVCFAPGAAAADRCCRSARSVRKRCLLWLSRLACVSPAVSARRLRLKRRGLAVSLLDRDARLLNLLGSKCGSLGVGETFSGCCILASRRSDFGSERERRAKLERKELLIIRDHTKMVVVSNSGYY